MAWLSMAWFSFSMEYSGDTKKSITLDLNPNVEESRLKVLTIPEQIITQVIEKVGRKITPLKHELIYTPETDSEMEIKQLPPTPDMSPIIRPVMPPTESTSFPYKWNQTQCCLRQTQDIIIELLINSKEIYLA